MAFKEFCLLVFLLAVMDSHATRNYKIKIIGTDLCSTHEDYYNGDESYFEINKYNESTDSINAVMDLMQDLPDNTIINIQSYERRNGEWEQGVVHMNQTWCDFMKDDPYFMESIIQHSNFPKECPITKNTIEIKDFVIDEEKLPEEIPGDEWRYVFEQSVNGVSIINFLIDIKIKRTHGQT
ncbi:uncharacterized protein [Periplaneta americana]|uniref:uncharacterized protein n=1 Tax=Periplaneta americana TaxID=6978 RepID=UPI0037E93F3B